MPILRTPTRRKIKNARPAPAVQYLGAGFLKFINKATARRNVRSLLRNAYDPPPTLRVTQEKDAPPSPTLYRNLAKGRCPFRISRWSFRP